LLRYALGEALSVTGLISRLGGPLSIGVPLALVWAYYGNWLAREIRSVENPPRRAGLNRFYYYLLALIGVVATFIGLALLFSFVVETLVSSQALWGELLRNRLSGALATLLAGLPLWLATWRPMQAEALAVDEAGDNARRSLVRRIYLYLAIFATVIGGMVSAIWMFYTLLYALLASPTATFATDVLNALQLLALFSAFLVYHWLTLRRDGGRKTDSLALLQREFPVLVFEQAESGFGPHVLEAIRRVAPAIPVVAQSVEQGIPAESEAVRAVILPSSLAFNPPEALRLWLKEYTGQKIIVPLETQGWYWPGGFPRNGISAAAQMVRQMSEGQEVRTTSGSSAWQMVAYVMAILFGIQLMFMLLMMGISFVVGGL